MVNQIQEDNIIKELADGLILRRARANDAEPLAAFNAKMHSRAAGEPDERVFHRTLTLCS